MLCDILVPEFNRIIHDPKFRKQTCTVSVPSMDEVRYDLVAVLIELLWSTERVGMDLSDGI
jgi:hypothetical protein